MGTFWRKEGETHLEVRLEVKSVLFCPSVLFCLSGKNTGKIQRKGIQEKLKRIQEIMGKFKEIQENSEEWKGLEIFKF